MGRKISDPPSKKSGVTTTSLDRRLNTQKVKDDDDSWNRMNIEDIRKSMAEDKAMLQATLREANRLMSDDGAPPLVDIGGVVHPDIDNMQRRTIYLEEDDVGVASGGEGDAAVLAEQSPAAHPADGPVATSAMPSQSATFLTGIDEGDVDLSSVDSKAITLGQDLEFRVRALEEILGADRARTLREAIIQDKRADRARLEKLQLALKSAGGEMDGVVMEHRKEISHLQQGMQSLRGEIDTYKDRLKAFEATEKEAGDKVKTREGEIRMLRQELEASNIKVRGEEVERLKLLDKVKKRELEVVRLRETMEKVSQQLSRAVEEKDHVQTIVTEVQQRARGLADRLESTNEELKKKDSELRVLKRNQLSNQPQEVRHLGDRLRQMDVDRKRAQQHETEAKAELVKIKSTYAAKDIELVNLRAELSTMKKRAEEAEKTVKHLKNTYEGDRKLKDMENKRLLDKASYYRVKLHGEEDQRIRSRADSQALQNDLMGLRKRNMELLAQMHSLDEARMHAERSARDAISRCKELQEKLDLQSTVQRHELTKLQYEAGRSTEMDVDDAFSLSRVTKKSRAPSRARTTTPANRSLTKRARSRTGPSTSDGGVRLPPPPRGSSPAPPQPVVSVSEADESTNSSSGLAGNISPRAPSPRADSVASNITGTADASHEVDRAELTSQVRQLQARLDSEERARIAAQERMVELAEQLLQKEREKEVAIAQQSKGQVRKDNKLKLRELQSHNLALANKINDLEISKEQMTFKLKERDDELKTQKKRCQDLLFRIQVEEEARNRALDQLQTNSVHSQPAVQAA